MPLADLLECGGEPAEDCLVFEVISGPFFEGLYLRSFFSGGRLRCTSFIGLVWRIELAICIEQLPGWWCSIVLSSKIDIEGIKGGFEFPICHLDQVAELSRLWHLLFISAPDDDVCK